MSIEERGGVRFEREIMLNTMLGERLVSMVKIARNMASEEQKKVSFVGNGRLYQAYPDGEVRGYKLVELEESEVIKP